MAETYGEIVGCSDMHYAKVKTDTAEKYETELNKYLAPVAEIQHDVKTEFNTRHYDNKPMFTSASEDNTNVKITVSGVPIKEAAEVTGKPYDEKTGIMFDTGDASKAPWCTLSGKMDLGEGGTRYFQYLKGKFALGSEEAQTQDGKINAKNVDLTFNAVITTHEWAMPDGTSSGLKGLKADTTDEAFTGDDSWLEQVQTPDTLGAPDKLEIVSSNPTDKATGIAKSSKQVITFSNKIKLDNVLMIKTSDNSLVNCTKTYDKDVKVLTITPKSSLVGSETYNIVVTGVTDIYGHELEATTITFTTSA